MNEQDAKTLLDYHIWADRQVWQCVETLSAKQYTQAHEYSKGSVHNHMFHLMGGDWFTMFLLQAGQYPDPSNPLMPKQEDFPDRPSLRTRWDMIEQEFADFVKSLGVDVWDTTMTLPAGNDSTFDATLGELLMAHVNHGTNHRAQVLARIHALGGKTVEQGFYFYLMSGQAGT